MTLRTVNTGDVLLFSGNNPTGVLLKTFVSSEYNHAGIAVRIKDKQPTFDLDGELYVYETNTGSRYDEVFGREMVGAAFSKLSFVLAKYNKVACRPLISTLRRPELLGNTMRFVAKHQGTEFPSSSLPFLSVWLGMDLVEGDKGPDMFCSELMANYYLQCVGPIYEYLCRTGKDISLPMLFGSNLPREPAMYTPGHYGVLLSPQACIFSSPEVTIYTHQGDLLYTAMQPALFGLAALVLIWMSLPQENEQKNNSKWRDS